MIYQYASISIRHFVDAYLDVYFDHVQAPLNLLLASRELNEEVTAFTKLARLTSLVRPLTLYCKPTTGQNHVVPDLLSIVKVLWLGRCWHLHLLNLQSSSGSDTPDELSNDLEMRALDGYLGMESLSRLFRYGYERPVTAGQRVDSKTS
jgi:hypothetical protein